MLAIKRLNALAITMIFAGPAFFAGAALFTGAALAGDGQPSAWQMNFQQSATPVMDNIVSFHTWLLWIIAAISAFSKSVQRPTALDPAGSNTWATVDSVTLMGNYATSGEYTGITISPDGLTVTIPPNWQSYQRDFTQWSGANAGQCNTLAFEAAFPPGRMVRIHTLTDRSFFATVQSASCAGPVTVTVYVGYDYLGYKPLKFPDLTIGVGEVIGKGLGCRTV